MKKWWYVMKMDIRKRDQLFCNSLVLKDNNRNAIDKTANFEKTRKRLYLSLIHLQKSRKLLQICVK